MRLASIIDGTGAGTWEWNVQTGETRFNERWAAIIGYAVEVSGPTSIQTWMQHAHPEDLQRSGELLNKHFAGELPNHVFEARMRHRDGHWVWVLDRGRVMTWTHDGKPAWKRQVLGWCSARYRAARPPMRHQLFGYKTFLELLIGRRALPCNDALAVFAVKKGRIDPGPVTTALSRNEGPLPRSLTPDAKQKWLKMADMPDLTSYAAAQQAPAPTRR